MGWSDIRMAMRYTHATGKGIRRAMQLLTQSKTGRMEVPIQALRIGTTQKSPHQTGTGSKRCP